MSDINELLARSKQLAAQREALEQELTRFKNQERQEVIAKIRSLMAEHDVTYPEILSRRSVPRETPPPRIKRKVAPKYRHPDTGETWSGRGLKPRWLVAAITAGQPVEHFKID